MKKIIWGALFTRREILGCAVSEGFEAGDIPMVRKNSRKTDLKK